MENLNINKDSKGTSIEQMKQDVEAYEKDLEEMGGGTMVEVWTRIHASRWQEEHKPEELEEMNKEMSQVYNELVDEYKNTEGFPTHLIPSIKDVNFAWALRIKDFKTMLREEFVLIDLEDAKGFLADNPSLSKSIESFQDDFNNLAKEIFSKYEVIAHYELLGNTPKMSPEFHSSMSELMDTLGDTVSPEELEVLRKKHNLLNNIRSLNGQIYA